MYTLSMQEKVTVVTALTEGKSMRSQGVGTWVNHGKSENEAGGHSEIS
jgi:hypothetical protein